MRVNTPQSRQSKKSRYFHVLVVLFLVPWIAGCGGSEDGGSEDAGTENGIPENSLSADQDQSPQNLSITGDGSSGDVSDDAAASPTAENPPGTLKLPSDLEKASSDGEKEAAEDTEGGIELPPDLGTSSTGAIDPPTVKFATWQEIDQFAKSVGRITVVDFWSLACEPCLEEFPGLVALHQAMGKNVQCIAVDVDYDGRKSRPPEYYQERVTGFLASVKATGFPTYISRTPSDDVYKSTKLISIPAVMIYDAKGEVVKVFVDTGEDNAFTYEKDIVPFVKSLAG